MITSVTNTRMKEVAALIQKAKERRETGLFVVEGSRMFEEIPDAMLKQVLVSETYLQKYGATEKLQRSSYEVISDEVAGKLSDTKTPQGILAVVRQKKYELVDMLHSNPMLLLLEDIQDPGNLGTMMRAGEGAGITGIVMTRNTVDLYNPKTIRSTMGSIFRVPFLYTNSLSDIVKELKENQISIYAAHLKGTKSYDQYQLTKGSAFMIGNEGNGLQENTACLADGYMKIPMLGEVESLNAGVAASLLLYEAARQRRNL